MVAKTTSVPVAPASTVRSTTASAGGNRMANSVSITVECGIIIILSVGCKTDCAISGGGSPS